MGNFSERTLEIPADLTDSPMRTEKELVWRTQTLHLEYQLPYAHGKVGIKEAQLKHNPQHQMFLSLSLCVVCVRERERHPVLLHCFFFLRASFSKLVLSQFLLCLKYAGRNTLCMYLLTRSQNVILFFLQSRNDIGLSNSFYIPICKDCVSSEVGLKNKMS